MVFGAQCLFKGMFGAGGVERILGLSLDSEEKEGFDNAHGL